MREIIFNDHIRTYQEWGLILTSQHIPAPEVKTYYVDVEYGHGVIDMTEAIDKTVFFGKRDCSFIFDLLENHSVSERIISEIFAQLHGKKMRINTPDRPQVYLLGRLNVSVERVKPNVVNVIVDATCDPFYYSNSLSEYSIEVGLGGPHNLIDNSNFGKGMENWTLSDVANEKDMFENNIRLIYRKENVSGDITITNGSGVNFYKDMEYTLSFKALDYYLNLFNIFHIKSSDSIVELNPNTLVDHGDTEVSIYGSALKQYSLTFKPDRDIIDGKIVIGNSFPNSYEHETGFYITEVKVNKGKLTDWSPSLKDSGQDTHELDILNGPIPVEAIVQVTADTWINVDNMTYFFNKNLSNNLNFRIPANATKLTFRTNDENKVVIKYYERSL